MSGVYTQDKLHLGTYGIGNVYSWLPLQLELENSGEAVLAMCEFRGQIYATSENNDMEGQHTRVLKRTPVGWVEAASLKGYAAYFMAVWGQYLIVTTTTDLRGIDYWYSTDGASFTKGISFGDWLWVPVVFQQTLYLLGHSGPAEGPGHSKAVRWTGNKWEDVPALCRPEVVEWQCGTEHGGKLYLGGGGWTLARGESEARVYCFDGQNCTLVKADHAYFECQALLSSKFNGYLYATFGQGFKVNEGNSRMWASKDGVTWLDAGTFEDCPNLYVMLDTPYGFVCSGGKEGNLRAYYFDTQVTTQPTNKCPRCGWTW
jgi:hypothetical protein